MARNIEAPEVTQKLLDYFKLRGSIDLELEETIQPVAIVASEQVQGTQPVEIEGPLPLPVTVTSLPSVPAPDPIYARLPTQARASGDATRYCAIVNQGGSAPRVTMYNQTGSGIVFRPVRLIATNAQSANSQLVIYLDGSAPNSPVPFNGVNLVDHRPNPTPLPAGGSASGGLYRVKGNGPSVNFSKAVAQFDLISRSHFVFDFPPQMIWWPGQVDRLQIVATTGALICAIEFDVWPP